MFRIEECGRKDCSIWIELNKEFMKGEIRGNELWKDVERMTDGELRKVFMEGLEKPEHIKFLLFEDDEHPVGFANLMLVYSVWSKGTAMIIDDMYFRSGKRGHGFGTRAMGMIEEYARELGCRRVQLQAEMSNPDAIEFYKSIGYQAADMKFFVKYLND